MRSLSPFPQELSSLHFNLSWYFTKYSSGSLGTSKQLSSWAAHSFFGPSQLTKYQRQNQVVLTTDGQSANLSWYQATIWDPRPMFLSLCWKLFLDMCVFLLWGSYSDERIGLYFTVVSGPPVQASSGLSPSGLVTLFYSFNFETSPTWRATFL
jgi:hypothetical protein